MRGINHPATEAIDMHALANRLHLNAQRDVDNVASYLAEAESALVTAAARINSLEEEMFSKPPTLLAWLKWKFLGRR